MVKAPARRELVRHMAEHGLSERHALRIVGMSASAYRYQPAPDRNQNCESKSLPWHTDIADMVPA